MEAKEEERIQQGQAVKNPPRETEMTPPTSGNERHRTEYTNGDDGRYDKSERGREGNEACTIEGDWNE